MAYLDTIIASPRGTHTAPVPADYYEGAHRVVRAGVPCRVFQKGITKAERDEIEFAAQAGIALTLPDAPGFTFEPTQDRTELLAKVTAYRAAYQPPERTATDYYKRAYRKLVHGVPCRVFHRGKSDRNFAQWAKPEPVDYCGDKWTDRAEAFRAELVRKGSYESAGVKEPGK